MIISNFLDEINYTDEIGYTEYPIPIDLERLIMLHKKNQSLGNFDLIVYFASSNIYLIFFSNQVSH